MQLVLELLKKIFIALQGVYTKAETDSALAERDADIATNTESISRAELIERYRGQTYCELTIEKVDGIDVAHLPRIEATGVWYLDLDDGRGVQTMIDDNIIVDFEWGEQTTKNILIYGAVTKIYQNVATHADAPRTFRYLTSRLYVVSDILISINRICLGGVRSLYAHIVVTTNTTGSLVPAGLLGLTTEGGQNGEVNRLYVEVPHMSCNYVGNSMRIASSASVIAPNAEYFALFNVAALRNNSTFLLQENRKDFSSPSNLQILGDNLVRYINLALTTTTTRICTTNANLKSFRGTMPKLSDAPNAFVNSSLDVESIIGVLNKLPTYTDEGTHRIGFTTNKTNTGIAHTDTTETFTVTDDDGTEYSVENCPLFTNDDADSTLRKAYVIAIAKKGWEVLI